MLCLFLLLALLLCLRFANKTLLICRNLSFLLLFLLQPIRCLLEFHPVTGAPIGLGREELHALCFFLGGGINSFSLDDDDGRERNQLTQ